MPAGGIYLTRPPKKAGNTAPPRSQPSSLKPPGVDLERDHKNSSAHAKQVDAWLESNIKGLPRSEQLRALEIAVLAVQRRVLRTLSEVTLAAVVDRALHEGQLKHPLLQNVVIEPTRMTFTGPLAERGSQIPDERELISSFRFLFIELFLILENLTAGILVQPLYRELSRAALGSEEGENG
jgi:hypothetical protein